MNRPLILDESIEVNRPLNETFAYISEFSRIQEWDPAVARAKKLTPGAPGASPGWAQQVSCSSRPDNNPAGSSWTLR